MDNCDILSRSDKINEQKELLILIRYICIILNIHYEINIEMHPPRNTKEIFTYNSDKYWSRILHAWNEIVTNNSMTKDIIFKAVHKGGSINYLTYWYYIFKNNNTLLQKTEFANQLKIENKYYLLSAYSIDIESYVESSVEIKNLFKIDKLITDVLFYMRHTVLNKKYCKYMIEYIIDKKYISTYIIDKVYNYLSSEYISPMVDSENRKDILNLFYDLLDI